MTASLAYGRRPVDPARPALQFASFLNRAAVPHPDRADYLHELTRWKMLGNDAFGDCNAVTWANERRLISHKLGKRTRYPSMKQVLEFYRTQNPRFDPNGDPSTDGPGSPADGGMSVQHGLEYLHGSGGPDGVKAVAFAKVDPADHDAVQAALAIFGSLWLGLLVLDGNQQQFADGQPWTDIAGARIDGGHAVLAGGYDPSGAVKFITWGQETALAPSFWDGRASGSRLVEEAWVVIWPEHLGTKAFEMGVDLASLRDAYARLTGSSLVLPSNL